jgi:biopolymer transport protein TolR
MGMSIGGGGGPKSDINMTPMIDVLLVLIIIFMVITPLTPKGLEALVPQPPPPNQPPAPDDRTVVVTINKDHSMLVNTEPIQENALGKRLEDIFKTRSDRIMFVKGDPDIEYRYVAEVVDIAHGAGIDKIGLMPFKDLGEK